MIYSTIQFHKNEFIVKVNYIGKKLERNQNL